MLLTIDLKGKTLHALAELLEVEAKQIKTKEFYFGTGHSWTLRPSEDQLEIRTLLEVDPIKSIPADAPYSTSGGLMGKFIHPRTHTATTALSHALLGFFHPILDKVQDHNWLSRGLEITCVLPPILGSEEVFQQLFGQIGYELEVAPLDAPHLYSLTLKGNFSLPRLLWDLIMIIPALDVHRYYWTPVEDMTFIMERIEEYSPQHPNPHLLGKAYQINNNIPFNHLLKQLTRYSDLSMDRAAEEAPVYERESQAWSRGALAEQMYGCLSDVEAKSPLMIGVGDGQLLALLLQDPRFEQMIGVDPSLGKLQSLGVNLGNVEIPEGHQPAIQLWVGDLTYMDRRLEGKDAIILGEPLNLYPAHSQEVLQNYIFGKLTPSAVLIHVFNSDYDRLIPGLSPGAKRHPRSQFSWGRKKINKWAKEMCGRYNYTLHNIPIGHQDPSAGAPVQLLLFHHTTQLG